MAQSKPLQISHMAMFIGSGMVIGYGVIMIVALADAAMAVLGMGLFICGLSFKIWEDKTRGTK